MKQVFSRWFTRYFSDPEAVILAVIIAFALFVLYTAGYMLAPVFAGLVIAYLLEGLVSRLSGMKVPHVWAVSLVFLLFMGALVILLLFMLPLLIRQLTNMFTEMPNTLGQMQSLLLQLPERYPDYFTVEQITQFIGQFKTSSIQFGQRILSFSIASIPALITMVVYLVLVPLLVFFFLLDRDKLTGWVVGFLPSKTRLMGEIWQEVDYQLGNYVRGKFIEIVIVGIAAYIPFVLMGLPYSFLLAVLVGLSVLIPFIGVTIITIPVEIIAFLHWGWSPEFAWLTVIYAMICLLDANLLVPVLFSEAVNLHPVAIIIAILFFGGLWGFWGVFFAIPLATLVQAMMLAWPRTHQRGDVPT